MTTPITHGRPEAERRQAKFESAQAIAAQNGLPSYPAWRMSLERRYTVMPLWYWDESICRQNYAAQVRDIIDWQAKQARINRGSWSLQQAISPGR